MGSLTVVNLCAIAIAYISSCDAGVIDLNLAAPILSKNSNFGTVYNDNSQKTVKHITQINQNEINNNINTNNYVSEKNLGLLHKLGGKKPTGTATVPPAPPVPEGSDDEEQPAPEDGATGEGEEVPVEGEPSEGEPADGEPSEGEPVEGESPTEEASGDGAPEEGSGGGGPAEEEEPSGGCEDGTCS